MCHLSATVYSYRLGITSTKQKGHTMQKLEMAQEIAELQEKLDTANRLISDLSRWLNNSESENAFLRELFTKK